jgi:inhibitor of KinA sporulation pathway (predicted exonuclease)
MPSAIIFDLEFTAWAGSLESRWLKPGEFKEVVQIGAIRVDAETFDELAPFDALVRPRINPAISDYLVTLTGITNAAIASRGTDFLLAYERFVAFADGAPIVAFGRDDLVLTHNLRLYGIAGATPLPRYVNIAPWLADNGIDPRGLHACDIAQAAGATFEGRRHDALEDARSVALGVKTLVARGARNPLRQDTVAP